MNEAWWIDAQQLDDDQRVVAALPPDQNYLVTGPPGSGKTNLLVLRAKYYYAKNIHDIAVLCFNSTLREFIRAGSKNYGFPDDRVQTMTGWMRSVLKRYGAAVPHGGSFSESRIALREAVEKMLVKEELSHLCEALLLDEGQDYLPEEIRLFAKCAKRLFIVADSQQKIYDGEDPFAVIKELRIPRHNLTFHYRNGHKICAFADAVAKDREKFTPLLPTSRYPEDKKPSRWDPHPCSNLEEQIGGLLTRIPDQLAAYSGEMIGILCMTREALTAVGAKLTEAFGEISAIQGATDYIEFRPEHRICVCTIHSSKGLEFRAAHLVGLEDIRKFANQRRTIYTAVTRAKTKLDLYWSGNMTGYFEQALAVFEPKPGEPKLGDLFNKKG